MRVFETRSDHAGEEEASFMLHLRPDLVRKDKLADNPRRFPKLKAIEEIGAEFVRPWHLYLPVSAGGDSTRATAEKGKTVLDSAIEGTGKFLAELSKAPESETFPY